METPSIQTPSSSVRSALGHRDFRLYWTGQTISILGDQFHTIALVWLLNGSLLSWNVQLLFVGAAALMIGVAIYIYVTGDRYQIGDQLV